jgi:hypothetical protein
MNTGTQPDEGVAVGVEVKTAPTTVEPWVTSFGVINKGLELMTSISAILSL